MRSAVIITLLIEGSVMESLINIQVFNIAPQYVLTFALKIFIEAFLQIPIEHLDCIGVSLLVSKAVIIKVACNNAFGNLPAQDGVLVQHFELAFVVYWEFQQQLLAILKRQPINDSLNIFFKFSLAIVDEVFWHIMVSSWILNLELEIVISFDLVEVDILATVLGIAHGPLLILGHVFMCRGVPRIHKIYLLHWPSIILLFIKHFKRSYLACTLLLLFFIGLDQLVLKLWFDCASFLEQLGWCLRCLIRIGANSFSKTAKGI